MTRSRPASAIVVGGGVAGLSCALRLAGEGVRVTLVETRKKLGGRATSFVDARTGETLDNCQHVILGCCANFRALCARLGVDGLIAWDARTRFLEAGGRMSALSPGLLPAPAHFAASFFRARFLTRAEKRAVARGMLTAARADRAAWADRTFADFLDHAKQPAGAVAKVWAPIVVSACNLRVERVSAATALHVFQEGFLARRDAAAIGVPAVPLVQLYDPAVEAIERAGGSVRLGAAAVRVGEREVELASGETLVGDVVVCAVPAERAAKIVDEAVQRGDARFAALAGVEFSPIVSAHLRFDRPVMAPPHAALVERQTQWLFRKDDAGTRVHAVVSAADEWVELAEEEIGARALADIRACLPAAERAQALSLRAVKEKRATFAATPEFERRRPATTGPSDLILAGDYVATGWPATMEGACISGELAAAAALMLPVRSFVQRAAQPSWLYRAVGGVV